MGSGALTPASERTARGWVIVEAVTARAGGAGPQMRAGLMGAFTIRARRNGAIDVKIGWYFGPFGMKIGISRLRATRVVRGGALPYSFAMADSEPGGEVARSELRASHEDRDRVVELLRVSAGDGRLTAKVGSGHLVARPQRRTFWQWLTRQPRPYEIEAR